MISIRGIRLRHRPAFETNGQPTTTMIAIFLIWVYVVWDIIFREDIDADKLQKSNANLNTIYFLPSNVGESIIEKNNEVCCNEPTINYISNDDNKKDDEDEDDDGFYLCWMTEVDMDDLDKGNWSLSVEAKGGVYDANTRTHEVYAAYTHKKVKLFAYNTKDGELKIVKIVKVKKEEYIDDNKKDDQDEYEEYPHWMTQADMDDLDKGHWSLGVEAKGGVYDVNTCTHEVYTSNTHKKVKLFAYDTEDGGLKITKTKKQ